MSEKLSQMTGGRPASALAASPLIQAAALALVTALVAMGTLSVPRNAGFVSPVWLVNAFALALLMRTPARHWAVLMAAFAIALVGANGLYRAGLPMAVALAVSNTIEVVVCAAIMRRRGRETDLSRPADLAAFALAAGLIAPFCSALPAVLALHQGTGMPLLINIAIWTAGHGLGLMILTPALLGLAEVRKDLAERPVTPLGVAAWIAVCAATVVALLQARFPLLFLVLPALLFMTVQMERQGAIIGVLTVAAITAGMSYAGSGPLTGIGSGATDQILVLQLFLAVSIGISFPVAALHKQWRRLRQTMAAAVEEAREQSRRAAMAEAVAGVGHWRIHRASEQMTWSGNMTQIFGLPPGEAPTLEGAVAMVHPDDRAASTRRLALALAGERPEDAITRLIRPDGEVRYVSVHMLPERDPSGEVTGVLGAMVDITDQQRAEKAIVESETRYRRLADNASDIIATYLPDGTFLYVSPSVQALLGYSPEELVGRNTSLVIHPDDLEDVLVQFRAYMEAGPQASPPHIRYRAVTKDGRILCFEAHPRANYGEDGTIIELQDVVRDVTVREAIKAELVEARRVAEAAVQVKSEFLANMSHELRTPLTSILGFTRLAAEQADLTGVARGYVERVADASAALLCTVNDILDFSKVEAGQVTIRAEPFSPAKLARSTLGLFTPQAGAKDLDLVLDCDLPDGAAVLADPDRLRQVLLNLVGNAVKFTRQGQVVLTVRHAEGRLRVEVADTGEGITPEAAGRLFRRFSQVDGSSTRAHSGTGLGLAICKGLVEAMGGEIGVDSAPGEGSRFWFYIAAPSATLAAEDDGPTDNVLQAPARPARGARVLVADDHPANRELARLFLAAIGAEITEAVDGADAVALARACPFDLILMDVRMPGMNGVEATRAIRAGGPNHSIPILAFTANADDHDDGYFRAQGFDGVVAKPLDATALITAVTEATSLAIPALEVTAAAAERG